jgi:hypothetical protein
VSTNLEEVIVISDEYMMKAANKMQDAADRAERAANRIEEAAHKMACMFQDGYGGNALKLIELLEKEQP